MKPCVKIIAGSWSMLKQVLRTSVDIEAKSLTASDLVQFVEKLACIKQKHVVNTSVVL